MKAAIVTAAGVTPAYLDFEEPVAQLGEELITITAAALSPLTRGRAAGTHYSSRTPFPFVAGMDGVGRRANGQRVYFALPRAPFGGMAERAPVTAARCIPLPDALDDTTAAALANPGMSSWVAFAERARLQRGETVLINGATGVSGRLAIQIARHFGARQVIATGRDEAALRGLGADAVLPLTLPEAVLTSRMEEVFAAGVDVVLDYLWGQSAEHLLRAAAKVAARLRYVEVGAASGASISLPGEVLRAAAIAIMGSGIGSVPMPRIIACVADLLQAAPLAGLTIAVDQRPLTQVTEAWNAGSPAKRLVFTP